MKKLFCILLVIIMIFAMSGCGSSSEDSSKDNENSEESGTDTEDIEVDLTKLSSTMVYSEVYNMVVTPDDYLGKRVKMSGTFGVYQDPSTEKYYYACLIADATACCSQGIEFVLEGDYSYPDDYPEVGSDITVAGVFDVYEENGDTYCQLVNAIME